MKPVKITLLLSLLIVVVATLTVVSALTITNPLPLYYDNGTYVILPNGEYTTIEKIDNIWYVDGEVYPAEGEPTPTPSPTPEPTETPTTTTTITMVEIVLIVFFLVFVNLAFFTKEPFVFAIAAFTSIILGLDLALTNIGESSSWIFDIVGFALIMFGIWLLIAAIQFSNSNKKRGKPDG